MGENFLNVFCPKSLPKSKFLGGRREFSKKRYWDFILILVKIKILVKNKFCVFLYIWLIPPKYFFLVGQTLENLNQKLALTSEIYLAYIAYMI